MVKIILKAATFFIIALLSLLTLISCEDVVTVDLETSEPKLVIDASIKWQKGTTGNEQYIYLSTTGDFYASNTPKVSGAIVSITDESLNTYTFTETSTAGTYYCDTFLPQIGIEYTLTINYKGENYSAVEIFKACPEITNVSQKNDAGFTGEETELKFFFDDPFTTEDYYLVQFNKGDSTLPEYNVISDEFFQGNTMFGLYTNEDLKAGNVITFTLHGISKSYYNYMNVLLSVAGSNSGTPFQTPPASVRGNIVNQTNFNNYALGFFRLSEIDSMPYTVE